MKFIPKIKYKLWKLKCYLKNSIILGKEARVLKEVEWALFKLDDKPYQSWSIFMAVANYYKDIDGINSCAKFLGLGLTIQEIKERCLK